MDECIGRKALVHRLKNPYLFNITQRIFDIISEIPAADVVPVVHGRWVYGEDDNIQCSICGHDAYTEGDYRQVKTNYCPNCGARMDKEDEYETD